MNSVQRCMRHIVILAALTALMSATSLDAAAQGIVSETIWHGRRPPTPHRRRIQRIRLAEHTVKITVNDQVARTDIVQVFFNPNPWQMEGVYVFPLPRGAAVGEFTMSMGGKQVKGEILDARQARDIYRSIVHRRRDPGLLEYAGRGCIRARLFPIPARGTTRVTLSFSQVLKTEGGLIEFSYPLRSDKFAPGPVKISGQIDIRSRVGVSNVFSPSHKLDVVRKGENHVLASFEESRSAADRDLRILYGLGRKDFGLTLTTHRPKGKDGYFLMLLAPNTSTKKNVVLPKDIVFVLDTSGSMGDRGGEKLVQAKAALTYALGRLDPRDRFNVIAFSTMARSFREAPVAATRENVKAAVEYVTGQQATGGTAIHAALQRALTLQRAEGRVPIVIFLTDGQPTIGTTDGRKILQHTAAANKAKARLFVFGVGDDVNATLLTGLAEQSRGSANFVSEKENIEIKVSAFYDKVASPVLTDVSIAIADVGQYDVYPPKMRDLFKGQQVVVVGRYKQAGPRAITLSGKLGGEKISFVYEASFGSDAKLNFLPRLWAVRKVGFVLNEIRRNGENAELVKTIKDLGLRHGIVTPYTSFLVVEERELRRRGLRPAGGPGLGGGGRWAHDEGDASADMEVVKEALRKKTASGKGAVGGAKLAGEYGESKKDDVAGVGVKTVGEKTFRYRNGVWTDTSIPKERSAPGKSVKYLSDEYDKLLDDETLARYLSVGARVEVMHKGVLYTITE